MANVPASSTTTPRSASPPRRALHHVQRREVDGGRRDRRPGQRGQRRRRPRRDHQVRDERAAHRVPDRALRLGPEALVALQGRGDRRRDVVDRRPVPGDRADRIQSGDPLHRRDHPIERSRSPRAAERDPRDIAVLQQVAGDRHALAGVPVRDVAGRLARRVDDLQLADRRRRRATHGPPGRRDLEAQPRIAGARIAGIDQRRLGLVRGDREAERPGAARVVGVEVRERDPRTASRRPGTRACAANDAGCRCRCRPGHRRPARGSRSGRAGGRRRSPA